jgi:hypothetical protein
VLNSVLFIVRVSEEVDDLFIVQLDVRGGDGDDGTAASLVDLVEYLGYDSGNDAQPGIIGQCRYCCSHRVRLSTCIGQQCTSCLPVG